MWNSVDMGEGRRGRGRMFFRKQRKDLKMGRGTPKCGMVRCDSRSGNVILERSNAVELPAPMARATRGLDQSVNTSCV